MYLFSNRRTKIFLQTFESFTVSDLNKDKHISVTNQNGRSNSILAFGNPPPTQKFLIVQWIHNIRARYWRIFHRSKGSGQ